MKIFSETQFLAIFSSQRISNTEFNDSTNAEALNLGRKKLLLGSNYDFLFGRLKDNFDPRDVDWLTAMADRLVEI